jgi:hypothetical protein
MGLNIAWIGQKVKRCRLRRRAARVDSPQEHRLRLWITPWSTLRRRLRWSSWAALTAAGRFLHHISASSKPQRLKGAQIDRPAAYNLFKRGGGRAMTASRWLCSEIEKRPARAVVSTTGFRQFTPTNSLAFFPWGDSVTAVVVCGRSRSGVGDCEH